MEGSLDEREKKDARASFLGVVVGAGGAGAGDACLLGAGAATGVVVEARLCSPSSFLPAPPPSAPSSMFNELFLFLGCGRPSSVH